jgi:5-formyltetrahydrofolate cyclo-ligase
MLKKELRKFSREKRLQLSLHDMEMFQDLILIRFQRMALPFVTYVHTYITMRAMHEVNPDPLVRSLEFQNPGMLIIVPRINEMDELEHIVVNEETIWVDNRYGIPEPLSGDKVKAEMIDLVFVPLLGFDERGNRVGYGKGYYDRFLAGCREDVLIIGLSFLEAVREIIDAEAWDVPLHYCITPNKVYEF